MIALTADPAQTKRTIELIWLAQDIDNTIALARTTMAANDFDWRGLGLHRPPTWNDIRRAMLGWAIDQQQEDHHVRDSHRTDRSHPPFRAPAQVGHANPALVRKPRGQMLAVPADYR